LAEAVYRKNMEFWGKTTQALVAHDEILASWKVLEYLAKITARLSRTELLRELQELRSGPQRERNCAVVREDWYAQHRERLLDGLIERFEGEKDAASPRLRPPRREAG
jgi:hypothetical protein